MEDTADLKEIKNQTGIDAMKLRIFVRRCLEFDNELQTIWGFRALIPRKRTSDRDGLIKSGYIENELYNDLL